MGKQNCWEFKKCGREQGGAKSNEMGVCPAASFKVANGFCQGQNGGRACMFITGTFCGGTVQGTSRDKLKNCEKCAFFEIVTKEHGDGASNLAFTKYILK